MRNIRAFACAITLLAACDQRPLEESAVALDPCGQVVDVALQKQALQLLIDGGLNEKLDPKVAPAGTLTSVVDAYRAKSGELRSRFGFTRLTKVTDTGASLSGCRALFPLQGGQLGMIGSLASPSTADALYEYVSGQTKWIHNPNGYQPLPMAVTTTAPLQSTGLASAASINSVIDPDFALSGTVAMSAMVDAAGNLGYEIYDVNTGAIIQSFTLAPIQASTYRVVSGGIYLALVVVDQTAFPYTVRITTYNTSTGAIATAAVSGAVVNAAKALDAVTRPGQSTILIGYSLNAGGFQVAEFNPAVGAVVTGPTSIAGGNVSAVGWLHDRFGTVSYYLAYSDAGAGLAVKRLTAAFGVVSTTVVDATKIASTSITGFLSSSAPSYTVISNNGAGRTDTNAAILVLGLLPLSKVFLIGTKYYIIVYKNSSVQPTAFIIGADTATQDLIGNRIAGIIMPGTAGGVTSTSLLVSVAVSGTAAWTALSHVTKQTNSFYSTTKQTLRATITFTPKLRNARELSGTTFFPGGMVTQFDGTSADLATFPLYPELSTFGTAAGGSMTPSGVYQYVTVFRTVDAAGRIRRSAPSTPLKVTLGAGDHSAQVSSSTLTIGPIAGISDPAVEFYRAGPAAAGGIVYNKVGEVASSTTVASVTFNDTMSDTSAANGELLYDPLANSGVLNNFPSPSTQLLEVLDNRVFIVSAENPTEIWPSKEYKSGQGLAFNPNLRIFITGGPTTALAAMDGRLVAFQGTSTWVIPIGAGPNDNGQGTFGDPQLVSTNIGCIDPNSVVATPDGIMFQAKQGIYLLTRGLDMQFIGAAVDDDMASIKLDSNGFSGAALVEGTNQVRFHADDGISQGSPARVLVYDYFFKQWYAWNIPTNDNTMAGVTSVGGSSYYMDISGQVWQETSSFNDDGAAINWSFGLPHLALGQLGGRFLAYEIQVIGTYIGGHTLAVFDQLNYGTNTVFGSKSIASAPPAYQLAFRPRFQKSGAMRLTVTVSPSSTNEGARISGLSLIYGTKPGRFPLPANRRLA